jgi:uncharacterized protein
MAAPTTLSTRIESIDILRGFALLGIVLVHMVEQYYAGQPPETVRNAMTSTIPDMIAAGFVGIFIVGKFYMIFSFLFGLSFFIQFSKHQDSTFLLRFAWRLVILFAIGLVHHLHYRGDILTIYALLGFGLLIFYRLPDRALLICGLILVFNLPSVIIRFVNLFISTDTAQGNASSEHLLVYYNTIKHGSYFEILSANLREFVGKMIFQFTSGRIFITFGLFLLGIYVGRKKFFNNIEEHLALIRKLLRVSLYTIGGIIAIGGSVIGGLSFFDLMTEQLGMLVGGLAYDTFNAALATIYVGGIILLLRKDKWFRRLHIFYPVGRMGLTTYLMQTAIGITIMFSIGFGLAYVLGSALSMLIGLLIFAFQIWFAHVWFRRFAYGPVEWLWRVLTYLKVVPLTRYKQAEAVS